MSAPEFAIAPVTSKADYDALLNLVVDLYITFPEDAPLLHKSLVAMKQNSQSLMVMGRTNGDPSAFFILGLDEAPVLQAFYVPPGIRNNHLGTSMFQAMATMMQMSEIEQVSISAWGDNVRFFERLGAQHASGVLPAETGIRPMTFAPTALKQPKSWLDRFRAKGR